MSGVDNRLWWFVRRNIIFGSTNEDTETEDRTMFTPIRKLARALRVPSAAEREMMYLNGARDLVDLEYRQREIDRGVFRRGF
jgi:dihydrofolate reductase